MPHFPVLILPTWIIEQEKEAKKEAFRKYLEASGVLDALTKGSVLLPKLVSIVIILFWLIFL